MAQPPLSLPYHLRSPRLRWASLAIDLAEDQVLSLKLIATDPAQSAKDRRRAQLLLGLHQRVPIHELCAELHMDRRTLFRAATELKEDHARRAFVSAHETTPSHSARTLSIVPATNVAETTAPA